MKTFVIQSENINGYNLPAQSFGYTAIEAVQYTNWFRDSQVYDFVLNSDLNFKSANYDYLNKNCIPIGSVDYVLRWLELMGVQNVKPLNIPHELWKFCDRTVTVDYCSNVNGHLMLKDVDKIKSELNGEVWFNGDGGKDKKYFLTEWVDNVESEWRYFVFNGKIRGCQCYSGDSSLCPDKEYVQDVVKTYKKRCYTLDVMVSDGGKHTEILELHDFFSCGLYGFEDFSVLPAMWATAIADLLNRN